MKGRANENFTTTTAHSDFSATLPGLDFNWTNPLGRFGRKSFGRGQTSRSFALEDFDVDRIIPARQQY